MDFHILNCFPLNMVMKITDLFFFGSKFPLQKLHPNQTFGPGFFVVCTKRLPRRTSTPTLKAASFQTPQSPMQLSSFAWSASQWGKRKIHCFWNGSHGCFLNAFLFIEHILQKTRGFTSFLRGAHELQTFDFRLSSPDSAAKTTPAKKRRGLLVLDAVAYNRPRMGKRCPKMERNLADHPDYPERFVPETNYPKNPTTQLSH